ncbi:SPW repeat domain-containing protein [Oharaeibacter diazotrophicus]|uniref:SPW repeat-containing protein n=1 Tax=Oharaeibacter diazotrophicus TaxID=1920512 RepID=A0A4R6RBV4_9HYPH|nr:SPW repeat protein [Oharaeibacter diazotrophicus]TDP83524.1 SPW repeat-containing protein [Oharaeibacter diazotrophicus]BBE72357.1 SPW repeat protein [Pleomorphomonas sp. SM30]GLS79128.1 hypothetical protein GCM10007904_44650 [Oharaeibacter diazotrophicus]
MQASKSTQRTVVRVLAALAGTALLFSPFVLGLTAATAAAWSAWAIGFAIFAGNMSMAVDDRRRPDVANLALGAAAIVAPSLAGFSDEPGALWIHGVTGLATLSLGAYALWALVAPRRGAAEAA